MGSVSGKRDGYWLTIIIVFLIASGIIVPSLSFSADDAWVVLPGSDPYWSTPANWSLGHAPVTGDNVNISSQGANATLIYDTLNNPTLGTMQIDGTGGTTIELKQDQGTLTSNNLTIGIDGLGIYSQSSGTNSFAQSINNSALILGSNSGSKGIYNMSGGTISHTGVFAQHDYIGYYGTGIFNQTGGSHSSWGNSIGLQAGSVGIYNLIDGVYNSAGGPDGGESIGVYGTGTFNQSGGSNDAVTMILGANVGGTGTYNLSNGTLTTYRRLNIGYKGDGTFNQSGGITYANQGVLVGVEVGGSGIYNLSNGSLVKMSGVYDFSVGCSGTGTFNQTGGTVSFTGMGEQAFIYQSSLIIGKNAGSSGTYNLSGGTLTATSTGGDNIEYVGFNGNGTFNQSGGVHTVSHAITIAANAGSSGTYNFSGGSLQAGSIVNNGLFNYTGGTLVTQSGLNNNGTLTLSGSGIRTIEGDVTNNGTVKVTNTIVQYTGTFTNNGAYVSDPTINLFQNLIIGQDGYIQAGMDDLFIISGYFENYSTNSLWDTSDAFLGFTGNGSHDLYQANDTHWGTLSLYGCYLNLLGTGNLYVNNLFGLTFDDSGFITNIWGNGLNIYYDALYCNWLQGQTFSLMGGGSLIACNTEAPVPEPSTMLLLGAGLLGLAGFRKKMRR